MGVRGGGGKTAGGVEVNTITGVGWVFGVEVGRRQEAQKYDHTRWGGCVRGGGGKMAGGAGAEVSSSTEVG